MKTLMLPASTVPQSGQVLVSHHCRVSSMTYSLHLNMMIRQMVSRGLVYPLRVSRLTYTAPKLPGIVAILRRRFMGHQDAVMLILDHHHTVVRAQRVGAVNRTLRHWGEGQQLPQHFLW